MLVSEVALGKCMDMYQKDLTLTKAPEGYHSVHGVKSSPEEQSAFKVNMIFLALMWTVE